ncbi:DUF4926 domain-containing protein [Leptospira alexanderi]|uniref:DUF4926 domain-containing protein n=1 Tax=Leptospira alexanderi TaxID=100053 RepID=UPI001115563B|nr:DUF4926 domain-containing protein [Leptospira alexanderi]
MKQYSKVKIKTNKYILENVDVGQQGYIIEVYPDGNYEVEFSNKETGETIALLVLNEKEIELDE